MALANVRALTVRQTSDILGVSPGSVRILRDRGILKDISGLEGRERTRSLFDPVQVSQVKKTEQHLLVLRPRRGRSAATQSQNGEVLTLLREIKTMLIDSGFGPRTDGQ